MPSLGRVCIISSAISIPPPARASNCTCRRMGTNNWQEVWTRGFGVPAMPTRRVHRALLRSHHEVVDVVRHEAQTRRCHRLALLVLSTERNRNHNDGVSSRDVTHVELDGVLRLRQHVERPRTHLSVGRHRHQVVRVLRAHHLHAVHGMLTKENTTL